MNSFRKIFYIGAVGLSLGLGSVSAWAAITSDPTTALAKAGKQFASAGEDWDGGGLNTSTCKSTEPIPTGAFTEICQGSYRSLGPGGGGDFKVAFHCSGVFTKKAKGYQFSPKQLDCEDDE